MDQDIFQSIYFTTKQTWDVMSLSSNLLTVIPPGTTVNVIIIESFSSATETATYPAVQLNQTPFSYYEEGEESGIQTTCDLYTNPVSLSSTVSNLSTLTFSEQGVFQLMLDTKPNNSFALVLKSDTNLQMILRQNDLRCLVVDNNLY